MVMNPNTLRYSSAALDVMVTASTAAAEGILKEEEKVPTAALFVSTPSDYGMKRDAAEAWQATRTFALENFGLAKIAETNRNGLKKQTFSLALAGQSSDVGLDIWKGIEQTLMDNYIPAMTPVLGEELAREWKSELMKILPSEKKFSGPENKMKTDSRLAREKFLWKTFVPLQAPYIPATVEHMKLNSKNEEERCEFNKKEAMESLKAICFGESEFKEMMKMKDCQIMDVKVMPTSPYPVRGNSAMTLAVKKDEKKFVFAVPHTLYRLDAPLAKEFVKFLKNEMKAVDVTAKKTKGTNDAQFADPFERQTIWQKKFEIPSASKENMYQKLYLCGLLYMKLTGSKAVNEITCPSMKEAFGEKYADARNYVEKTAASILENSNVYLEHKKKQEEKRSEMIMEDRILANPHNKSIYLQLKGKPEKEKIDAIKETAKKSFQQITNKESDIYFIEKQYPENYTMYINSENMAMTGWYVRSSVAYEIASKVFGVSDRNAVWPNDGFRLEIRIAKAIKEGQIPGVYFKIPCLNKGLTVSKATINNSGDKISQGIAWLEKKIKTEAERQDEEGVSTWRERSGQNEKYTVTYGIDINPDNFETEKKSAVDWIKNVETEFKELFPEIPFHFDYNVDKNAERAEKNEKESNKTLAIWNSELGEKNNEPDFEHNDDDYDFIDPDSEITEEPSR